MGAGDEVRAVALKCQNCGANLTTPADVDTLACGYCGAQQTVRREGGTVSLRLEQAVAAVRANTDRMAAELALARSQRDLADVEKKLDGTELDLKKIADWVAGRSPTSRGGIGGRADFRLRPVCLSGLG